MFGWKKIDVETAPNLGAFGFRLERVETGQWFEVWWGQRYWCFTRYTANRHTGPEYNIKVLKWFFGGPERRTKTKAFSDAFKERSGE